jgi:hypothetical protein
MDYGIGIVLTGVFSDGDDRQFSSKDRQTEKYTATGLYTAD